MFTHMWHSHKLLTGGTGAELALFALIWFIPAISAVTMFVIFTKRSIKRSHEQIRPMDAD